MADAGARRIDADSSAALLPDRSPDSHKGTYGTLICVCGSLDYAGAALLCGTAAARVGTGLVGLAVPASLQPIFAGRVPELITVGLPEGETGADIDAQASGHALKERAVDALVFGSGLRESPGYGELLLGLLRRSGPPLVVDGGGLNLLSRSGEWWSGVGRECVLTPHPGEFARLMDATAGITDEERLASARSAAGRFRQVVVLKGAHTVVAAPDGRSARAGFANAALSTAGSGDVLTGTIGGLLAQGVGPFDAACLGVWLHGRAAELVGERLGDSGLLASDLPYNIALARRELEELRG